MASAAQQATHRDLTYIYLSATLPINRLTLMAGRAVAQTHGRSIKKNLCGLPIRRLYITVHRSIHRATRLIIHSSQPPASSLTMALAISSKHPMDVGTILPPEAHRAASCVSFDRAPARQPAPRNGISRLARAMVFIRCMCIFLPFEPRVKAQSIRFTMQTDQTRSCSTNPSSRISTTSQMDGSISADTTSTAREANTSNSRIGLRMNLPTCRIYTWVWMPSDSYLMELRLRLRQAPLLSPQPLRQR